MVEQLGRSASDELADLLAASIVNGELKPGERLIESDLAAQFKVSRGPVRSALATLVGLGLVEMLPRRGMVVVELTPSDARDLYDVRIALERAAVERLLAASDVDWSRLRDKIPELEEADRTGDSAAATRSSLGFHYNLCALAGNKRLLRVWEAHSELIKLAIWMRQSAGGARATSEDPTLHDHRDLIDALVARDSARAVDLIVSHLEATRDDLVRILEASETSAGSLERATAVTR
jgi:DNA-binding GntR family transcriptional regulator